MNRANSPGGDRSEAPLQDTEKREDVLSPSIKKECRSGPCHDPRRASGHEWREPARRRTPM